MYSIFLAKSASVKQNRLSKPVVQIGPDLPPAEKAAREVLAIPIYPELTDRMKDYVAETVLSFLD